MLWNHSQLLCPSLSLCYESGKISTLNNSTLTILPMFKKQQNSDILHPIEEEELGTEMEKKLPEM